MSAEKVEPLEPTKTLKKQLSSSFNKGTSFVKQHGPLKIENLKKRNAPLSPVLADNSAFGERCAKRKKSNFINKRFVYKRKPSVRPFRAKTFPMMGKHYRGKHGAVLYKFYKLMTDFKSKFTI